CRPDKSQSRPAVAPGPTADSTSPENRPIERRSTAHKNRHRPAIFLRIPCSPPIVRRQICSLLICGQEQLEYSRQEAYARSWSSGLLSNSVFEQIRLPDSTLLVESLT